MRRERDRGRHLGYHAMLRHKETIRQLVIKYKGLCALCGGQVSLRHDADDQATIDHIVPLGKGGLDVPSNQQLACYACNADKADNLPEGMEDA